MDPSEIPTNPVTNPPASLEAVVDAAAGRRPSPLPDMEVGIIYSLSALHHLIAGVLDAYVEGKVSKCVGAPELRRAAPHAFVPIQAELRRSTDLIQGYLTSLSDRQQE